MTLQQAQAIRSSAPAVRTGLREWIRDHDNRALFVVLYLGLSIGLSIFVGLFWLVVVVALHFVLECIRQAHHWHERPTVFYHALWEVKLDIGLVILAFTLVLYIDVVLGLLGVQAASRAAVATRAGARIGARAVAWERNLRTFLLTVDEMARIGHAAVMYRGRRTSARQGLDAPAKADAAPAAAVQVQHAAQVESVAQVGGTGQVEPTEPVAPVEQIGEVGRVDHAGQGEEARLAGKAAAAAPPEPETDTPRPPRVPAWEQPWGWGDRIGLTLVGVGVSLILIAPFVTPHDLASTVTTLLAQLHPFPATT